MWLFQNVHNGNEIAKIRAFHTMRGGLRTEGHFPHALCIMHEAFIVCATYNPRNKQRTNERIITSHFSTSRSRRERSSNQELFPRSRSDSIGIGIPGARGLPGNQRRLRQISTVRDAIDRAHLEASPGSKDSQSLARCRALSAT